jgi:hypothetical protein
MKYVGENYPIVYDSLCKERFGTHLGIKTAGRNIILMIYLPIILACLYALKLLKNLLCWIACPKKK